MGNLITRQLCVSFGSNENGKPTTVFSANSFFEVLGKISGYSVEEKITVFDAKVIG